MKRLLVIGFSLLIAIAAQGQTRTTMGNDFWISYLYFTYDYYAPQYSVSLELFASGPRACTVSLENPNTGWSTSFYVVPGLVSHEIIPFNTGCTATSGQITPTAVHVTSTDSISLYLIMLGHNNLDITNALPTDALKSDYLVQCYPSKRGTDYRSEIVIVAAEDSTVVDFTVTAPTMNGFAAGSTHTITLQQGDVYQIRGATNVAEADLTGTTIHARDCKKIAVHSGHFCAYVPSNPSTPSCDHIFDQCMPTDYWGTQFVVAGTGTNFNDHVRVMPSEDNCQLFINGRLVQTLNTGQIYDFELSASNRTAFVETSVPACVYLFMGSAGDYDGDPSMVVMNPVDQAVREITFGTYSTAYTRTHYINITAQSDEMGNILLDNSPITSQPVNGTSLYRTARIPVAQGSHTICSTGNKGFLAYAFGIGSHESYGYSVGSSLVVVPSTILFVDGYRVENGDTITICRGDTSELFCVANGAVLPWRWYVDDRFIDLSDTLRFSSNESGVFHIKARLDSMATHPCINIDYDTVCEVVVIVQPTYVVSAHDTIPISRLPWQYNGRVYYDSVSNDTIYLETTHHCDSIIVYSLSVFNDTNYIDVYDTICAGSPYTGYGFNLSDMETSIPGDSILVMRESTNVTFLHLTKLSPPALRIEDAEYESECYTLTAITEADSVEWSALPFDTTLLEQQNDFTVTVCPNVRTTYQVTAFFTQVENCSTTKSIDLTPRKKYEEDLIWIPNVFTPDESGNNCFKAWGTNIIEYEITIFHRWGGIAYHSTDMGACWDGKMNGEKCPSGTYTYLVLYRNLYSPSEQKKKFGTVTIIR